MRGCTFQQCKSGATSTSHRRDRKPQFRRMLIFIEREVGKRLKLALVVEAAKRGITDKSQRSHVGEQRSVANGVAEAQSAIAGGQRQEVGSHLPAVRRAELRDQQAGRGRGACLNVGFRPAASRVRRFG